MSYSNYQLNNAYDIGYQSFFTGYENPYHPIDEMELFKQFESGLSDAELLENRKHETKYYNYGDLF